MTYGDRVLTHFAPLCPFCAHFGPAAYDWLKMLDIRGEKQFAVGKYGVLHVYLDIFNAFNVNMITSGTSTVTSPLYGTNNYLSLLKTSSPVPPYGSPGPYPGTPRPA